MACHEFTDDPQLDDIDLHSLGPLHSNASDISDYLSDYISAIALSGVDATVQVGEIFAEESKKIFDSLIMIVSVSNQISYDDLFLQPWHDDSVEFDSLLQKCNINESNQDTVIEFFKRNRPYLTLFLESIDEINPLFGEEVQITLRYIDDSYEAIKALFCGIVTNLDADTAYDLLGKFEEDWLEKQSYDFQDNVIYTLGYK